ncbi:MAG TPA: ScyD/ScyE family protein [Candidatus Dormibacteraeota bacterium]|nr:ScyD/ScyE family protein [Candidatus Dormibacteraeota bacterium]
MRKRHLFALLAAGVVAALLPIPAAAAPSVTTIATGLDSPRGVAFFNGKLLVGEAGHGGSNCFNAPGVPFPICIGNSSQISWVNTTNGSHTPLVSGLFSVSLGPEGTLGVSGLSVGDGRILAQIGATPREAPPTITIAQQEAGRLISVRPDGTWTSVAEVGTVDFDYTTQFTEPTPGVFSPNTQEHDSNPYGVLATEEGAYVADAGANTLDRINGDGKIKIMIHDLWRDPNPNNFPSDSVPTCVVRGDDGLLVGELSGRLLRVNGTSFSPVVVKDAAGNSLLTHVTGCTSDGRGNVYFVNMFGSGAPFTPPPTSNFFFGNVVQYNTETGKASVLAGHLNFPNMATVGPDGNLYVSTGAICGSTGVAGPPCFGATGSVVRIALPNGEND